MMPLLLPLWLLCANLVLWVQCLLICLLCRRLQRVSRSRQCLHRQVRLLEVCQQGRVSHAVSVASQAACALARVGVPHREMPISGCERLYPEHAERQKQRRERQTDALTFPLRGWYGRQSALHAQLAVDLTAFSDAFPLGSDLAIALQRAKQAGMREALV